MKKYTLFLQLPLLFLVAALLLVPFSDLFLSSPKAANMALAAEQPVIILDAGHGGEDGGTSSADGVLEKDLNLSLSGMLAEMLRMAGYQVVETRTEDRLLYDADTQKGHKKQADLEARLKIAEQYPNGILISIHMNSYPGVLCTGLQVWYSANHPDSASYAAAVQDGVKGLLQPGNNRKIKTATSGIYLLKKAEIPAILIECGFLSTPEEAERLATEEYRRQIAFAIFASLTKKIEKDSCAGTAEMV